MRRVPTRPPSEMPTSLIESIDLSLRLSIRHLAEMVDFERIRRAGLGMVVDLDVWGRERLHKAIDWHGQVSGE